MDFYGGNVPSSPPPLVYTEVAILGTLLRIAYKAAGILVCALQLFFVNTFAGFKNIWELVMCLCRSDRYL